MLTDLVCVGVTVADHEKEARAEADGLPEVERVIVPVADTDLDTVPVALTEPERVIDGDAVPELLTDLVCVGVTVADHVKEAFAELDGDPVVVTDTVFERLTVGLTVPVGDIVGDLVKLGEAVPEGETVILGELVVDTVPEREIDGDGVPVGETEELTVGVIVCVPAERVEEGVFVPVTLGLPLTVPVLVTLVDGVPDTLRDGDTVPVGLTVPDRLIVGEALLEGLLEAAERVAVTVFVPDTDGELETVADPVTLTEPD